jgi:metallo-beta-lactamase class B
MTKRPWLGCLLCVAAWSAASAGAGVFAQTAAPTEASVQAHVDAATTAAGDDLKPLLALCTAPPAVKPPKEETEHQLEKLIGQTPPPPGQAFDNLYFVGAKWVSAWAITTSKGIILLDALDNRREAAQLIEGGLKSLGLDPRKIRYIIVTHGHGDHYGGARYLADRYHARIVMSREDWNMTATHLEFESALWDAPPKRNPKRDIAARDGQKIRLGDTVVTLYLTPGHTMGTISPVFDVHAGGQTHRVLEWGGTAFNFGRDIPRLDSYVAATDRMRTIAGEQNIDVLISNHSGYDEAIDKLARVKAQGALTPSPFVLGTPGVVRALTTMNECASAARDRFLLKP